MARDRNLTRARSWLQWRSRSAGGIRFGVHFIWIRCLRRNQADGVLRWSINVVTIATEAGVPAEGLGLCVRSGRYNDLVEASYQNAVQDLRLTGTPSVFVGGLKVGDYASMDEYLRLIRLYDALSAE